MKQAFEVLIRSLRGFLLTFFRLVSGCPRNAVDFLFGFDVFISYRWQDGTDYAHELSKLLVNQGLICFLDKEGFIPGNDLGWATRKAVKRSRVLVLVGTAGALESEYVDHEIQLFAKTDKLIIPIDVDGSLQTADHDSLVRRFLSKDPLWLIDPTGSPEPTLYVASEITRAIGTNRQSSRRIQYLSVAVLFFVAISILATLFYFNSQRNLAHSQSREIASKSMVTLKKDSIDALRQAIHAVEKSPTFEAENVLRLALDYPKPISIMRFKGSNSPRAVLDK